MRLGKCNVQPVKWPATKLCTFNLAKKVLLRNTSNFPMIVVVVTLFLQNFQSNWENRTW